MTATNPELELANDFVQYTDCNIFLTGKAGTGKTTFLHNLKKRSAKRMIITAPTGVAAINAGGVTLHSFFQLPFGPFVPGSETYERNKQRLFRFSKEKKQIIKSLDLLVIDEISMVRADLLDAVDSTLRRHRRNNQPFGGVQLLMIGDLHQLSPVAKRDEWQLLQQHYESVYFFSSKALARTKLVPIELKHIYRQSDAKFIKLLNQVRDNHLDDKAIGELSTRYIPNFTPGDDQGYITLTTHNSSAEAINKSRLKSLAGKERRFQAEISGEFPEHIFPTQGALLLKEGAQVMFVRNDPSTDKLYYNGKIGKISSISSKGVRVLCPGDQQEIVVEPVSWQNIQYTLDEKTSEINENIIGRFSQYPLKPAWAITIHKSQGLTFDKAVIDARAAFTHGQVYVALSRCKTLEGMVLNSPIQPGGIKTDKAILDFDTHARQNKPSAEQLQTAKISYQQHLLLDCFDFHLLMNRLNYLVRLLLGNAQVVHVTGVEDIRHVQKQTGKDIVNVGESFKHQLNSLFSNALPESDPVILERINKASVWFQEKFTSILRQVTENMVMETDNVAIRKKTKRALNNLKQEIAVKLAGIKSCEQEFSPAAYLRAVSAAEIDFRPDRETKRKAPAYSESDVSHPQLFQSLKEWRTQKAKEEEVPHFRILHQSVLIQICVYLPDSTKSLQKIRGIGPKTAEKYGRELVTLVTEYRKQHNIVEVVLPEPAMPPEKSAATKDRPPRSDTKQTSLAMFHSGLTIVEISKERGLVPSTIEGHLAYFVEKGELDINKLLSAEKQKIIGEKLDEMRKNSLSEIKNALGDDCSYGEIKMMLAHRKYLADK